MVFRDRQSAWEWCAEEPGGIQGRQVKVILSTRRIRVMKKILGMLVEPAALGEPVLVKIRSSHHWVY
ncbi:MAG: hypothetical protein CMP98_09315 [Gammaproteobacteria bacterium]|nr:hypothetical protein [Gammaproteobacteria bacterium]MAW28985.1 hypothetical protein [Gammaproteobacteria bacterium]OUU08861.1 MAG: hypothetical protein CBB94_09545 [Gammaproteobacteria bacterium TMED34]OUU09011.1 MAG: hypothetical protein CBB94_08570 [Gammaproteobacteria bacterium TMED34]